MNENRQAPNIFISYSWSSPDHCQRVLELAERLTNDGIHVSLDVWDLKEGQDKHVFMEQMVSNTEIDRVLLISDRLYKEKAYARAGGVGTESQIISGNIYDETEQTKFIPIVAERDAEGVEYLPAYLSSRMYIDLSNPGSFSSEYEKLLRVIYDKPEKSRPAIGSTPSFLTDQPAATAQPSIEFNNIKLARSNGNLDLQIKLRSFFDSAIHAMEEYRIDKDPVGEVDDLIASHIQSLKRRIQF